MNDRTYYPHWLTAITDEIPDDTILWRYITLEKYLKMFSQNGLYLRKLNKLEYYYEGVPQGIHFKKSLDTMKQYSGKEYAQQVFKSIDGLRDRVYVNCWNIKEIESYVLWKGYSDFFTGVAIKTTYQSIKNYFNSFTEDSPLFFGKIIYNDTPYNLSQWSIAFTKRKMFIEESEFRIMFRPITSYQDGVIIPGDIKLLVNEIYLAPKMSSELQKLIINFSIKNGIESSKIIKSELFPYFDPMRIQFEEI